MLGKNIEVYLVGAAGVETIFWVTKLEKWVTKMSFSHSTGVALIVFYLLYPLFQGAHANQNSNSLILDQHFHITQI